MCLEQRDWIMLGIGFGVGMIVFTQLGRETVTTVGKYGKSKAKKALKKIRKKAK